MDQLEAILPGLLACLGAHSTFASLNSVSRKNQGFQITHLVLRTIEGIVIGNRTIAKKSSSFTAPPSAPMARAANTSASSISEESETDSNKKENHLEMVRQMCSQDDVIGRSVYDLLLDVILYQIGNESTNLPPPGLSSLGKERLSCGNSVIAKNWAIEYASGSRLKDLKIILLDFIAPCRRFDLFNVSSRKACEDDSSRIATSRAVALLVICSGDQNLDVAERASSFLKAHLDSMRNTTKKKSESIGTNDYQNNASDQVLGLLGNPIALVGELLSAVLGGIIASNAIEKIPNLSNCHTTLGQPFGIEGDKNILMSTKRRMVAAKNGTTIMTFLTMRVVDDLPSIFTPLSMKNRAETMNKEYVQACSLRANIVGTLTCVCANKYAKSANSLSGLSVTGAAGNPSIAAMKLMNSVCVRLVALFDAMTQMREHRSPIDRELVSIHDVLARCFSNACAIISTAASSHAGDVTSPIGVEARDAAYGIISTICRSNMVTFGDSIVLNCGERNTANKGSLCVKSANVLFGCVRNETENLRPRAVASLDSLLAAYCRLLETNQVPVKEEVQCALSANPWAMQIDDSPSEIKFEAKFVSLANALIPSLWNALQPTLPKASRHAAAQWTNALLKPIDLNSACHILCYVSGDNDVTAASLSNAALGIDGQIGLDIATSSVQGQEIAVPGFHEFAEAVFAENGGDSLWRPRFYDFNPAGKSASIRFGLVCLLSDLYGGIDNSTTTYLKCISYALNEATTSPKKVGAVQLLDEVSICFAGLLRTSQFARAAIASDESLNAVRIAELALSAPSSKARRYLAEAYLCLVEDSTIWTATKTFQPLQWKERTGIESIIKTCVTDLTEMTSTTTVAAKIHGAAYLGASCIRVLRDFWTSTAEDSEGELRDCLICASSLVTLLGRGLLHLDEVIGNACAGALTNAFSHSNVDTPTLCALLCDSSSTALKFTNTSLKRFGNGDHTDDLRVTMIARAAGVLLAATTVHGKSQGNEIGRRRLECIEGLLALLGSSANKKDPELALVVGEALSDYADAYSPEGCVWTYPAIDEPSEYDQTYADDLPPHAQVLYKVLHREILATSPQKRTAVAPVLLALVSRASKRVHQNATSLKREFVKMICEHLDNIQKALLLLLADPKSKQISRESCQLGLAACYGLSCLSLRQRGESATKSDSNSLNDSLLRAFGQTSNYGGSAMMESRTQHEERVGPAANSLMETADNEAEVGGAVGMSEAALGAFREMASASVVLGRPDILYSLMLLSVSLPLWQKSEYNATTLLGKSIDSNGDIGEIRVALRPHLEKLIPRLLRACNDPNKQTRNQMSTLWIGLTGGGAEARSLINEHLLSTIDSLMDDATSKLWRARVGSCTALAEIIVGRSWQDLGGGGEIDTFDDIGQGSNCAASRLLRLYRVTIRSLDDVRLAVREAGDMLSRSVRSLTTRLSDPSIENFDSSPYTMITKGDVLGKVQSSSSAAATVLPWLVKVGLNQSCAEAAGFSISCLLSIVDVARPQTLQPVLPQLIGSLLMSMSGLEPAALNYLQERAAGHDSTVGSYDRLERVRLQMAQSGPIAVALVKCIDMLRNVDIKCQKAVIPELDSALRCGAGFATRAASADAVSSLCSISPDAFKFSGTSTSNPTVRLLRALYYASERERGNGAKNKMSHALGNLSALAPGTSVRSLALKLCSRYVSAAGGTNDDPVARNAVANALRAIAIRASNQFSDGGSNNIWIRKVLPLAFVARFDKDVESLFQEVWDEGGQAARLGAVSFGSCLEETIIPYLSRTIIQSLEDVSWNRRKIACAALIELCDTNILSPPPRALAESKENVTREMKQRFILRAESSCRILGACVKLITTTRVWRGKEDLLKAVAKIAVNWMSTNNIDDNAGTGQEPIIDSQNPVFLDKETNDLFVGDKWYSKIHGDDAVEDMDVSPDDSSSTQSKPEAEDASESKSEAEDASKIIFSTGDALLLADDVEDCSDKDTRTTGAIIGVSFHGLCRLLLEQGVPTNAASLTNADYLTYRASAIDSLSKILDSMDNEEFTPYLRSAYIILAPHMLILMRDQKVEDQEVPPLIVARCFTCFSAVIFYGFGSSADMEDFGLLEITNLFKINSGTSQSAWTVREAAALAAAKLVKRGNYELLKRISITEDLLACTSQCLKDRKFWRVRLAGLQVVLSFCLRVRSLRPIGNIGMGSQPERSIIDGDKSQLLFEAILPFKERFAEFARASLSDKEAPVTAAASEIMKCIAWWP